MRYLPLSSLLVISVIPLLACGGSVADGAGGPPEAPKSPPESAFEPSSIAPRYQVTLFADSTTPTTVGVSADFGRELPGGAGIAVNGVRLSWGMLNEKTFGYAASLPVVNDDLYTFVLDIGGKLFKTPVRLVNTKITSPAQNAGVKFQSPFVVEWDREVQGTRIDATVANCFSDSYSSNVTARSATFDVTLRGSGACHAIAGLRVYSETPLELGAPFLAGSLYTHFIARDVEFEVTP